MSYHQIHGFFYEHPVIGALSGMGTTLLFSMADIPDTTLQMEFACTIVKLVGISAGSFVAVASFVQYIRKNWFNRKD